MYPTLYHAVLDIFGIEIGFFKIVMMFGFFVALGFLAANWVMTLELKRYEAEGKIKAFQKAIEKPNVIWEYFTSVLIGFVFGYKMVYLMLNFGEHSGNPQSFILSSEGSWLWGILLAVGFAGFKYYQLRNEPAFVEGQTRTFHPYEMMGNLTLIAAITGFAGAKLFHHLEYFSELVKDPMVLFRDPFSGLTYFGGLLGGAIGVIWYANKHGVKWKHMLDIGGPAMMLAYGVGRMGCHMSGDGDWGIENLSPKPGWLNWLPDWAWAYKYPGNVHNIVLENPVWPTPIYEVVMALIIFGILWSIRKRFVPGILFSIYLIFAGFERFLIEKIRVNPDQFNNIGFTQAELISLAMMFAGLVGIFYFHKTRPQKEVVEE
ncbi:MAG: diacylglyceryl transferase [Bacteroidetes bacterium]|nr:MAG: diacylglyceryl transferase [Bacteroidota bacterium]